MVCVICGSEEMVFIGVLGTLSHYRCRDCGAQHSDPEEDVTSGLEDADIVGAWGPEGYFDVMDQYDES